MIEKKIDFILVIDIVGMHFHQNREEGIDFTTADVDGLRFVLKPTEPDLDPWGDRNGLICKVVKSYMANEEQVMFVDAFNSRKVMLRVSEEISLPFKLKDKTLISEDGSFSKSFMPRRNMCPTDISMLIKNVETELLSSADHLLKLIRWSQGCDSSAEIIGSHNLYWKVENDEYPLAPRSDVSSDQLIYKGRLGINWSQEHSNDLQNLWATKDKIEPLGHTLLREATTLANESPRSSILIMTAALETAVKIYISHIAPETAWLMQEIPSPPIFKILKDYFPLIHNWSGRELDFWNKVKPSIKKVQKLIEVRNKIAHTGKIPEDADPIKDYLSLVTDFLYLLDVLNGHEWAKTLISPELRIVLGYPSPKDGRIILTISESD